MLGKPSHLLTRSLGIKRLNNSSADYQVKIRHLIYGVLASDCDQAPPEVNGNFDACCSFPNITDPVIDKKIQEMVKTLSLEGKDSYSVVCKVAQVIFNDMKLVKDNTVDKDAFQKMVDSYVTKDVEYWRQPLKDAYDHCQKTLMSDLAKVTDFFSKPPYNIKKEDCDVQYVALFTCIHLDSFANCPTAAWKPTNEKVCTTMKTWFGKCGTDFNGIKKIISG
ncbi:hypothetical protein ACKWTF_013253 [Chironomus riparius]